MFNISNQFDDLVKQGMLSNIDDVAAAEKWKDLVPPVIFNNVIRETSGTLKALASPEWGFDEPIADLDQILVRGARASRPQRWPEDRRRLDGRLLSDHAPVERTIE